MAERKAVLIIEDDVQVLGVMKRVMGRFKIPFFVGETGGAGLAAFEAHMDEIAVVLLDDHLPDMDTPLVYDGIKALRPEMPFVLTSGRTEGDIRDHFGPNRPFARFLAKPFSIITLRDWILAFVD